MMETIVVQTISTAELRDKFARNERFELWNVVADEFYPNENIAGSRYVPLDSIGREIAVMGLSKQTEIIVYCTSEECMFSSFAYEKLVRLGYTNVKVYAGGLASWKIAGLATEKFQSLIIPELWNPIAVRIYQ